MVVKKDSAATRERILEAAAGEFAELGIAGARVDRIAKNAECNKQLIYQYFESKEKLFHTVLVRELALATEGVQMLPEHLEEYAGAYFDFAMANPRVMRLIAWSGLETTPPATSPLPVQRKVARVAIAQQSRAISSRFSPEFVLLTISSVCSAWVSSNWYGRQLDPDAGTNAVRHREEVVRLIGLMVHPDSTR